MAPRHLDALLIGAGVAAARCARALRRGGFDGSVAIVGEEGLPPYNRPPLSKELLRGDLPDELVLAEPAAWYERRGVELLLGVPALALDPETREVELADGRRLAYGHCLLATGAEARRPAVPGAEHPLVLRTLSDALRIRERAVADGRAVVIGGGFIGVEVAASLAACGMRVTLLERSPALWGATFGQAVSDWAVERLRAVGVEVRFGVDAGTSDVAAADLVVAGVGVEPRVQLAIAAGVAVDDGILVDVRQAASAPGIFAAGDVARVQGRPRVEHWHAARESGERAGLAMIGEPVPPARAPWIFSEFAGATLDVVGVADPADEDVELAPGVIGFVRDDRLVQVVLLDGALPVEAARDLVERSAAQGELARWVGTR